MLDYVSNFIDKILPYHPIFLVLILLCYMFWLIHKDPKLTWVTTITDKVDGENQVSLTKLGQLIGIIMSTIIVVRLAWSGGLNWDLFSIWLTYLASSAHFSEYMMAKTQNKNPN